MINRILMMIVVGMLVGCASSHTSQNSYSTVRASAPDSGSQSGREQCVVTCNDTYSHCMESYGAQNSGVNGPSGMFGASADCRISLKDCLPRCKAR